METITESEEAQFNDVSLIEKVRDNAGYYSDHSSRCSPEMMVVIESLAICFQAILDKLDEIQKATEADDNLKFMTNLYKE